MAWSYLQQPPLARRQDRWFTPKLSLVINYTNLLFDFFFLCPPLLTSLLAHHTVVVTFQNLTCYFWDFDIFDRFNFFDRFNLTFLGLGQPFTLRQRSSLTLVVIFWLWFFGNALCHTTNNFTTQWLSQLRLRNIDLIRGCSPTIYPTVSFGQLELYIFLPPRFWSWNIIPIRVTTLHNIIHCLAYQWESKWAAWLLAWSSMSCN